jgi:hypothetical protein
MSRPASEPSGGGHASETIQASQMTCSHCQPEPYPADCQPTVVCITDAPRLVGMPAALAMNAESSVRLARSTSERPELHRNIRPPLHRSVHVPRRFSPENRHASTIASLGTHTTALEREARRQPMQSLLYRSREQRDNRGRGDNHGPSLAAHSEEAGRVRPRNFWRFDSTMGSPIRSRARSGHARRIPRNRTSGVSFDVCEGGDLAQICLHPKLGANIRLPFFETTATSDQRKPTS